MHATCMTSEGLLLGSRRLGFLAKTYAVNVLVFLSALYTIADRGMGLNAVWRALAAFQIVRLVTFAIKLRHVKLGFVRAASEDKP